MNVKQDPENSMYLAKNENEPCNTSRISFKPLLKYNSKLTALEDFYYFKRH